jgi:hypothetical protein
MQAEKRYVNGKWLSSPPSLVLLCEKTKVVLTPPVFDQDGKDEYFFRIITLRTANREDRAEALGGKEVKEPIEVQPDIPDRRPSIMKPTEQKTVAPTITTVPKPEVEKVEEETTPTLPAANEDHQRFLITPTCPKCGDTLIPNRGLFCQGCGVRLSTELAVHPELVIIIKRKDYEKLAVHVKQAANAAWTKCMKGRKVDRTLSSMGQNIFLITITDELRASNENAEQELDSILVDTGIGRLTTDPYELREAHKMLQQKPTQ